jgi:hypothetical protein
MIIELIFDRFKTQSATIHREDYRSYRTPYGTNENRSLTYPGSREYVLKHHLLTAGRQATLLKC